MYVWVRIGYWSGYTQTWIVRAKETDHLGFWGFDTRIFGNERTEKHDDDLRRAVFHGAPVRNSGLWQFRLGAAWRIQCSGPKEMQLAQITWVLTCETENGGLTAAFATSQVFCRFTAEVSPWHWRLGARRAVLQPPMHRFERNNSSHKNVKVSQSQSKEF